MDRNIVYPGAIPLETDILSPQRSAMIALGYLVQASLGTGTVVDGLACTQQTVPNMTVNIGPGSIISLSTVDATAFGSLTSVSDPLVKMGISSSTVVSSTLATIVAPGTTGQSINYLIQAAFQESDNGSLVLPYYNSSNPAVPYSGPANAGTAQNTQRLQKVNLGIKAGSPATTGSQVTPTPDSGFVGLWVVTVAYAQTSIVTGNISRYSAVPLANEQTGTGTRAGRLLNTQRFTSSGTYTRTPGTNTVAVQVWGSGQGGTGSTTTVAGGSGAAGGYAEGEFAAPATAVVTVPAGGAGGTTGGGAGGNGSTTSFGALISATGGVSNTGGTGTGGSLQVQGGSAMGAINTSSIGGIGGSAWGSSGGLPHSGGTAGSPGLPGSGGAGGSPNSGVAYTGGAGGAGLVIVMEYS